MSVTVVEKLESLETTDGKAITRVYFIEGTQSDTEAMTALKAEAPVVYNGLVRKPCRIEPLGLDSWLGEAPYAPSENTQQEPLEVGESSYNFETGGETQHITQSLQTIQKYAPAGKTAPDFKGAIGVTESGVEGVDIPVKAFNWSETHCKSNSDVDTAYKAALYNLTYTVNNAPFKNFAAGEVLFLGASGSRRGDGDWEITYRFASSPNKTGLTVGEITGIAKKGWEYMWVRYEDAEDDTAKALVKKPIAVYIEKVYESGNFSGLEL